MIAAFLLASWLLLGLCLFVDLTREHRTRYRLRDLGLYGLFSLAPSLLFVLLRATGLDMKNFQLLAFYGLVLLTIGALSILLRADTPLRGLPASPWRIAFAAASILASLPFIYATTIQGIQANMDHRRATLAYAQKRYDVAMVWCQQAVERAPHQVRYQMELAQALGAQAIFDARVTTDRERLFREAEQTLFRAVETNPFDAYPQAQLAEIYRVWANLTEDADNKAARYEEAVAALELAVLYNPENLAFMTKWAELYDELGEQALALATYRRALALDTTNAPLYMKVGRYYQEASQWQPAAAMYEAALRHSRQPLPAVHHTLAVLYQRLEHPEEAARQSEQAVAHAPDVPAYHTLLIDLYLHLGRCTEAREQAQAALRRWPAEAALQPHADRLAQQCPEQPAPG